MSALRILALRCSFALGSRLAPRRTARRATDLWFKVPRQPMPPPPAEPPGGTTRELTGDHGLVRARSWGTGPAVCFVHGWGGSGDQVHGFVEPLLRRGMRVVTFDAPGHGATPVGDTGHTNAVETARALRTVAAEHGPLHAVLAHSLGAAATIIAIRRQWIAPKQLVLIAPLTEVRSQLDRFVDALAVDQRARLHLDAEVLRHTGLGIDEFGYSGQDPLLGRLPLVAVHDRQDKFVPYRATADLVDSWPHSRVITTDGLGHVRILADPHLANELAAALAGYPEPAGHARSDEERAVR